MKNFARIPNRLSRCPDVTPSAKALFLAIASYNPSFPSYRRLGEVTGLSGATISKALKELVGFEILTYRRGSSDGKANEYFVRPEEEWSLLTSKNEARQNPKYADCQSQGDSDAKAQPLQNLKSNKTNSIKPIQKKQLSGLPERLREYLENIPPAKMRSELTKFNELRRANSAEDIDLCVQRLRKGGVKGEPCHSPLSYLAKAMPDVLKAVRSEHKSAQLKEQREREAEETRAREQREEDAHAREAQQTEDAFNRAFPDEESRSAALERFGLPANTIIPERLRRQLARDKWREHLSAEELAKWFAGTDLALPPSPASS